MSEHFDNEGTIPYSSKINIEYGLIHGNNKIVLIKGGQNSGIYGYQNKYLTMAKTLNSKFGCTVIVSSNPFDWTDQLSQAIHFLKYYCKQKNFDDFEIYYFGVSKGSTLGTLFAEKYPEIKKCILVNGPLMFNPQLINSGLEKLNGDSYLIYGTKDPSYSYLRFIPSTQGKIKIIENADHVFSGEHFQTFLQLPELFFNAEI